MVLSQKVINGLIDSPTLLEGYRLYVPDDYTRGRGHDLFHVPKSRTDVVAQHPVTWSIKLLSKSNIDIFECNLIRFKNLAREFLPAQRVDSCEGAL